MYPTIFRADRLQHARQNTITSYEGRALVLFCSQVPRKSLTTLAMAQFFHRLRQRRILGERGADRIARGATLP